MVNKIIDWLISMLQTRGFKLLTAEEYATLDKRLEALEKQTEEQQRRADNTASINEILDEWLNGEARS